jgi:hypothetical protein
VSSTPPILLSPSQLASLNFAAVKAALERGLTAGCLEWDVSPHVGEIIRSFSYPQLSAIAQRSEVVHVMRLAHGHNVHYWSDLRKAVERTDPLAIDFALLTAVMTPPPPLGA